MELPDALARTLRTQDGVAHIRDLRSGLSDSVIRRELRARRWTRYPGGVVVLHNGPPTPAQLMWAALEGSPPGSALSGPTALRLGGLARMPMLPVHVTIPRGHARPPVDAAVHWSGHLDERDVHPGLKPRRTRLARSVCDWAAWQDGDRAARGVVLDSFQQRLVSAEQMREALSRRGPCRHHAIILESIEDAVGGIASVPEREFVDIVRKWQLPTPEHQVIRRRPNGRYYLDVKWRTYDLSAEIEGVHHFAVEQREADLDRLNELTIDGEDVLLFTSFAIRHRPAKVGLLLMRALVARGWTGL